MSKQFAIRLDADSFARIGAANADTYARQKIQRWCEDNGLPYSAAEVMTETFGGQSAWDASVTWPMEHGWAIHFPDDE